MQKETEQKKRKQMEKFDMLGKHPGRALIFFAVPMKCLKKRKIPRNRLPLTKQK